MKDYIGAVRSAVANKGMYAAKCMYVACPKCGRGVGERCNMQEGSVGFAHTLRRNLADAHPELKPRKVNHKPFVPAEDSPEDGA